MHSGHIVSVSDRYGFIQDEMGVSFYFNSRSLSGEVKMQQLSISDKVEFDSKPGPKGMIATNVRKIQTYRAYCLGKKVVFSKRSDPFKNHEKPYGETFVRIQTTWHRSPDEARQVLDDVVQSSGANAVINTGMDRMTFNQGNYHYTMHSSYADIGVYFSTTAVESQDHAQNLTKESEAHAWQVNEKLEKWAHFLNEKRDRQMNPGPNAFVWIFNLCVLCVLVFMFAVVL